MLARVLELFGQLVSSWIDSRIMESNNIFWLVACVTIEHWQEDCHSLYLWKKIQFLLPLVTSRINLSPILSIRITRQSLISVFISSMRTKTGTRCFGESGIHCLAGLSPADQNVLGLWVRDWEQAGKRRETWECFIGSESVRFPFRLAKPGVFLFWLQCWKTRLICESG